MSSRVRGSGPAALGRRVETFVGPLTGGRRSVWDVVLAVAR